MSKGLYALTIAMTVILGILLVFAVKLDIRSQDFIDPTIPPCPEPAPSYEEDDWETPEF